MKEIENYEMALEVQNLLQCNKNRNEVRVLIAKMPFKLGLQLEIRNFEKKWKLRNCPWSSKLVAM